MSAILLSCSRVYVDRGSGGPPMSEMDRAVPAAQGQAESAITFIFKVDGEPDWHAQQRKQPGDVELKAKSPATTSPSP